MGARTGVRLSVILLVFTILLSGCNWAGLQRGAAEPCSIRGLTQAPIPALLPLPAWPVPEPETRKTELGLALFATLYEGAQARIVMDNDRKALVNGVEQVLAEQPVQLVRQGAWRALWPQVRPCLDGRPVIRLGFSGANRMTPPDVALLPFRQKDGEVLVKTSALWVAPSRAKGEPTWVIATAMGPMDQRSLIYRQPNTGYTLEGPVTVMAMPSTEAARTLAADLGGRLAAHGPSEAQAAALAEVEAAAQAGDWNRAHQVYERLLVATEREAREPGPPMPDMPFFAKEYRVVELSSPERLLQSARASMAAGRTVYGAREALLHASYLAEEQGKQELLTEIRSAFQEFMAMDLPWAEMQHRLAELESDKAERWWKLAEVSGSVIADGFQPEPAVAVAESLGGADPRRAADLYLRMAYEAAQVSPLDFRTKDEKRHMARAARLLEEALRRQPDHPYGLFLKGVRESRLGNTEAALQVLEQVEGRAAQHERAIARGSEVRPALTLDLYAAPASVTERGLKDAYIPMGYWYYSAKMPSPPRQEAVWAPDGQWVASTCTRFTGAGSGYGTDLCLIKVPEGSIERIAGAAPHWMEWTREGLLYSLGKGGLWFAAPGGAARKLAPVAYDLAVSPDGHQIAYSTGDGLWTLELGQGAPRRLTSGKHTRPLWSPDGRELFFAAETSKPVEHMAEQFIYRVAADGSAAPAEVGRQSLVSLMWYNISALRWWQPGETLLVRHNVYQLSEQQGQATLLPLDGAPVTVRDRLPTDMQERAESMHQIPTPHRDLVWVQDGTRLIPVPMGQGDAPPTFELGAFPGFASPAPGMVTFAPQGTALAYTYTFGEGAHLFLVSSTGDGRPTYLGPVELSVLGALRAEADAVPLEWYRQRALPGWPLSWSPDGRYLAWLHGDRLVLYAME